MGKQIARRPPETLSLRHFLVSVLVVSYPIMSSDALSTTAADNVAPTVPYSLRPRVAVIGAGAAGLAAARVISRDTGLLPVVLEKDLQGGGVWRYQPSAKDRPMYSGLRTNLPKELMAFREYPFHDTNIKESFVTHAQVQEYLLDYQRHFELNKYIHYGCTVRNLKVLHDTKSKLSPSSENWPQIQLEWTTTSTTTSTTDKHGDADVNMAPQREIFDAVLVCNGHYAAPSSPYIPGLDQYFQGKIMHSIEYDTPEQFRDQVVLCIGGRASGADLAREISCHAKHIYLSDTTCQEVKTNGKVTLVPKTISVDSDGRIQFAQECP
jgi:cation diffusion facilitator CzcD-associated flavoprotein CzcO